MKNVIKPLAKSALTPLRLTTVVSAADAGVHKRILGSRTTTLIISNDEMEDIVKIVKSLECSGLLLKGLSETSQNEAKEQKEGFLSMLLGTFGTSLLGNMSASKGAIATSQGQGINRAGQGIIRAGHGSEGSLIKRSMTKNF